MIRGIVLEAGRRRFGEIEHPLDQSADAVDPFLGVSQQAVGRVGRRQFFGQQLDVEIDAGQRIADLMGNAGG